MILVLKTADMTARLYLFKSAVSPQPMAELTWESGRKLSDDLPSRIIELLGGHREDLSKLTGIVVYSGPGSFTSLRIGHATANALAAGLDIPVVGAAGDDWIARGLDHVAGTPTGVSALPYYGAEAHITRPKT